MARPDEQQSTATGSGGRSAEALLPIVYEEFRKLAHERMAREPPGSTLEPTALVHEAYLRLVADQPRGWQGRGHFFAAAAEAMRRILVDRARARRTHKRGGDRIRLSLRDLDLLEEPGSDDLIALDEALKRLEMHDRRMSDVVKLRCFTGLTIEEVAEIMDVSVRTVHREWDVAKAWLRVEVGKGNEERSRSPGADEGPGRAG